MPALALAIPALIGAGTSIFGALSGRNAAKTAGTRQANASEDTINYLNARESEGRQGIDTAVGNAFNDVNPYATAGGTAEGQLSSLLAAPVDKFSYDPSKVAEDPGYQFTLAQGMKALDQSAAARGQALSGGQLKALTQFGQGNAATYENQFYNQALGTFDTNRDTLQQRIGNLFGQTSEGMQAAQFQGGTQMSGAQQQANLGLQYSNLYGNTQMRGADASAASTLGANGAFTNGITNAGSDIGQAIYLNQILKKPPTSNYPVVRPGDEAQFGG